VTQVYPLSGPSSGGTNVGFVGSGFSKYFKLSCAFGDEIVTATIVSDSLFVCTSPLFIGSVDSQLQLQIYMNDRELSPKSYPFTYFYFPVISGIYPLTGPEVGGWALSILFHQNITFSSHFMCRFAGHSSLVTASNHFGYSVCDVPELEVGNHSIEITFDGTFFFPLANQVIIYPQITMTSLSPDSGYINNNQSIIVLGTGMANFALCCEFDGRIFNGKSINDTAVECFPPIVNSARRSLVRVVSCDAFSSVDEFLVYEYVKGESVKSINPLLGFISGGTEIDIIGSGYSVATNYLCVFNRANVTDSESIVIPAGRINDRLLRCKSPSVSDIGQYTLGIYANFSSPSSLLSTTTFYYEDLPVFKSISPNIGTELGGTIVTVMVNSDLSNFKSVYCKFGSYLSDSALVIKNVNGTDDSAILCTSPAAPPSSDILVHISPNGFDFVPVKVGFYKYAVAPVITEIFPQLITNATKSIIVRGSNMNNSACCSFNSGADTTIATVISDSEISCPIPQSWNSYQIGFNTTVSISVNCQDYALTDFSVTKLLNPPYFNVYPAFGSVNGGTIVLITSSFDKYSQIKCAFGSTSSGDNIVDATYINSNTVSCRTPVSTARISPIHISIDGGVTYFISAGNTFQYLEDHVISSISPEIALEGQSFVLSFHGSHMKPNVPSTSYTPVCRLGTATFPLTELTDTKASCVVQVVDSVHLGSFSAGLSINGQDFVYHSSNLQIVPSITPSNVTSFMVFGSMKTEQEISFNASSMSNFALESLKSNAVLCSANSTSLHRAEITIGSDNSCTFRCHLSSLSVGEYELNVRLVSTGQYLFANSLALSVVSTPTVYETQPTIITAHSGSDSMSFVHFTGEFSSSVPYYCVFRSGSERADRDSLATSKSSPVYSNNSLIICELQIEEFLSSDKSVISMHILAGLGIDDSVPFFVSGISLLPPVNVLSIEPVKIVENRDHTVTLIGENFRFTPIAVCKVGSSIFNATVIDFETATCKIQVEVPGVYSVYFSVDGLTFTSSDKTITVSPSPIVAASQGLLTCPQGFSDAHIKIEGNGFDVLEASAYKCQYGSYSVPAKEVSDSYALCPCPDLSSTFDATYVHIPFALYTQGSVDPLFSTDIQYYKKPEFTVDTTTLSVGISTSINITFNRNSSMYDSSMSCKIDSSNFEVSDSQVHSIDGFYSTLTCTVRCNVGGEKVALVVGVNEEVYFDAGYITCSRQPELVSITPKIGVESGGYMVNTVVKYPVSANLPVYCIFGLTSEHIAATATVTLYRSDEKYLSVFCSAPKLPVGLTSVRVAFGTAIVSLPQAFEVYPIPSIVVENDVFKFPHNSNDIVVTMSSKNLLSNQNNQGFCQVNGSHLYAAPIIFSEIDAEVFL
jgi:hypothetical protein